MSELGAVEQAVELLRGRLVEARARQAELGVEIASIEKALDSLGVKVALTARVDGSAPAKRTFGGAASGGAASGKPQSVRSAVKAVLDGENRAFSPAEVRDLIPAEILDGKSKVNSVRTAMWSLRQKNEAKLVDETHTISMKWVSEESEPKPPAANGWVNPTPALEGAQI